MRHVHRNCMVQVKIDRISTTFPVSQSVKQGDPISPNLLNSILQGVYQNLNWKVME